MKIELPTVGPVVGYTGPNFVRFWAKGKFEKTADGYRRRFGVARIRPKGGEFGKPQFNKMTPTFDMSAVIAFGGLQPETDYEYQFGWFFDESDLEKVGKVQALVWEEVDIQNFRTAAADATRPRSYVFGSCRYFLRLLGGTFCDHRGDKTFRSILEQIADKQRVDALLMVGDQIYADDLNFFAPDTKADQFLERYRIVFSQEHIRRLMSSVPTYMILDDHEIEDNWPEKATDKDRLHLYPAAMHAYQVYQASHSPVFDLDKKTKRIDGTMEELWYKFQDGCCDFFVMDSRTERVWSKIPEERQMIGQPQLKELKKWLNDGSGRVKMVITSVPVFPDLKNESPDKWSGFLPQRTEILDFILEKKVQKVVFLSGDVHCSLSAQLISSKDPNFRVTSIISSSFFWPYPHMDEGGFMLKGKLKVTSGNDYNVVFDKKCKVAFTDNFTRLEVTSQDLTVKVYERKGDQIGSAITYQF